MANELKRAHARLSETEWRFFEALYSVYQPSRPLLIFNGEPHDLALAHARMGGEFDFAQLDGDPAEGGYPYNALEQLLPYLEESAYLLIHHAAHHRVAAAIDLALAAHADELIDCGLIGRGATWDVQHQVHYGGLRLLRYVRRRRLTVWQEGA